MYTPLCLPNFSLPSLPTSSLPTSLLLPSLLPTSSLLSSLLPPSLSPYFHPLILPTSTLSSFLLPPSLSPYIPSCLFLPSSIASCYVAQASFKLEIPMTHPLGLLDHRFVEFLTPLFIFMSYGRSHPAFLGCLGMSEQVYQARDAHHGQSWWDCLPLHGSFLSQ